MKKKKTIIIAIIAVILIIAGIGAFFYIREKNNNITILFNGEKISKYRNNTLPFTIESDEEITVNGEKYNGERIYKVGKYEIETPSSKRTVNIKPVDKDGKEYHFYTSQATLSTLYGALLRASHDDEYNYIYFNRKDTFDIDALKANKNFYVSQYVDVTLQMDELVTEEIKSEILRILDEDPDAHFHLYVDEFNYNVEYKTFAALGLNDERYDVTYLTNGTISYERPYVYVEKEESYEEYLKYKEEFDSLMDEVRKGNKIDTSVIYNHVLIAAARDNANYYLQYPEVLEIKDEKTKEALKVNYIAKSPTELYQALSKEEQEKVVKYVGLDKESMDKEYFNDTSKPYLILTGNTPMDYHYGEKNFKNMVEQVVKEYGDDYNILFKPHPAALPDVPYTKYFESLGIKILPGQMPMEVISFVYSDLKLGGFAGSLYMSVPSENALFLFAKDKNDLFKPLDMLCDTRFKDIKFIQPKK